jgi:small ligand-binding sensory domain FIST
MFQDEKMKVGIGYSNRKDGFLSGMAAAKNAIENGNIQSPDLMLAFCGRQVNHEDYFRGLQNVVGDQVPIIGGSALGIITNDSLSYEGYPAGATIIESKTLQFKKAAASGLDKDEKRTGCKLANRLAYGQEDKLLIIFYDSVKTPAKDQLPPVLNASSPLIEGIEQVLQSNVPIVGAGLVGDYDLGPTKQFCGSYVDSQSIVGVMLAGDFTPYFRIMHGCTPLSGVYHKITKMDGSIIYELDGKPIVEMIDELYRNRDWRHQRPVSLLTIGKNHGEKFAQPIEGNYVNRLITGCLPNGEGIGIFEPDFETGTEIQFMLRDGEKMIESAKKNSTELMDQIKADGKKAYFGLYIDCAGRTSGYSNTATEEASEIQSVFNQHNLPLFGFYSGVEVAPLLQKSRGLDWTGVLVVLAGEKGDG